MQGVIPLFVPFAAEHYLNLSFQAATENWQEFYCSPLRLGGKTDVQHAFFQCGNFIFFLPFSNWQRGLFEIFGFPDDEDDEAAPKKRARLDS